MAPPEMTASSAYWKRKYSAKNSTRYGPLTACGYYEYPWEYYEYPMGVLRVPMY